MVFPAAFTRPIIQDVNIRSSGIEKSTAHPALVTALYVFDRLSTSLSTKTMHVVSGIRVIYSANTSCDDLKKPESATNTTRRSAKNGMVSAKLITSSTETSLPSYFARFIWSPSFMSAFVSLSRYCFLR